MTLLVVEEDARLRHQRHTRLSAIREHLSTLYTLREPNVTRSWLHLRRKLEGLTGFKPIHTVRGHGYLLAERYT
jgi:two-component system response regulator PhoP